MDDLVGIVYAPEPLGPARIVIEHGRVAAIRPLRDRPGLPIVVPGLIDLQVNGAGGVDLWDGAGDLSLVARTLAAGGVTGFLGTLVSAERDRYPAALERLRPRAFAGGARLLGVHVEGPFLTVAGAHDPATLRDPGADEVAALAASGVVRMVTLAPERQGALAAIRTLRGAGVVVSLGHSRADEDDARAALAAGATVGTHLFNAMEPFHHRAPGLIGALLVGGASACLIADGVHVADTALRLAAALLAPDRLVIVSDAVAGLGVTDGPAARLADGTLAGSLSPLIEGVRRLHRLGVPLEHALSAATTNPSRLLGLARGDGTIAVGAPADLVTLDADLRIEQVLVGGEAVA